MRLMMGTGTWWVLPLKESFSRVMANEVALPHHRYIVAPKFCRHFFLLHARLTVLKVGWIFYWACCWMIMYSLAFTLISFQGGWCTRYVSHLVEWFPAYGWNKMDGSAR
jgi:hypothetical protein